jgi:hypothetical protein
MKINFFWEHIESLNLLLGEFFRKITQFALFIGPEFIKVPLLEIFDEI